MKLGFLLNVRHGVAGCLCAASLVAVGCADGRGVPTGPSASVSVSGLAANATGDQQSSAFSPIDRLFLTKTCDAAFPTTPICTVQVSEAGPFPQGTEAYYTFAVLDFNKLLSASVVLTIPGGDTATGHCTLSFKTGLGRCTFARGTGALAGLHANVEVSFDSTTGVTIWDGTYYLAGPD